MSAALVAGLGLLALSGAPPQGPPPAISQTPGRPLGEGPLGNDVFLPTSEAAARALAAGDEAFARTDGDPTRRRDEALEAWNRALAESEPFDCAPLSTGSTGSTGTATPRGTEAVEVAVARRLRAAGADVARAWRERFEPGASAALLAAGTDPVSLARVERTFPMTRDGARAALALADRAYESGALVGAATWLDRARSHADAADRPLAEAIARRAKALEGKAAADPAGGWRGARGLALASTVALAPDPAPERGGTVNEGIEPGVVFLADGRICVQGSGSVHVVDEAGRTESFDLLASVHGHGWVWPAPFAEDGERWPLLPATLGSKVFVVAGRAVNAQGNALLAVDARLGASRPELAWAYSDAGYLAEDGTTVSMNEALGPGLWEFEPGPVVVEGALIVQARQWLGERDEPPAVDERSVRAWCLALDPGTGSPRWKRLVGVGASGKSRLQGARGFARPAQPIAAQGGRILVGTGVGAAAWIDAEDGRITATLRYRRAPEGARTWNLSSPLVLDPEAPNSDAEESGPILWAPPDSDRGYVLHPAEAGGFGGAYRIETREIGRDAAPFGAAGARAILLAAGERTSFGCMSLSTGSRFDSVALPRSDREPARGLASRSRAFAADDRAAYLLDVDAELRLLAAVPLPGRAEDPLGSIAARGDRLCIAGERTLWILNAR